MANETIHPWFEKELMAPLNYLIASGGKKLRPKIIKAFNVWLKIPNEAVILISEIVDLLHNSSLLIDDIEDNSELRRGVTAAHLIYGIPATLNCGNYCYFLGLKKLLDSFPKDKVDKAVVIFTDKLLTLHRGQGRDIYWRDKSICPSEEEYIEMIQGKTGASLVFTVEIMQLFSDYDKDLREVIECLGKYFQIRDDYLNLTSKDFHELKGFADDLSEGKYSFPIIHAIRSNPDDHTIEDILKMRTKNVQLKNIAINKMWDLGSFDYTVDYLQKVDNKLKGLIEGLGGNPEMDKFMDIFRKLS